MSSILEGKKHIHMIGIGGSGMYPLAQVLHAKGYYLTGSDNNETDTLAAVRALGIPVQLGQRAENIEGADLVVYSAAIAKTNPDDMTDAQVADLKAGREKLMESAQKLFAKVYEQAQGAAGQGGAAGADYSQAGGGYSQNTSGSSTPDDDVVDGDYREV